MNPSIVARAQYLRREICRRERVYEEDDTRSARGGYGDEDLTAWIDELLALYDANEGLCEISDVCFDPQLTLLDGGLS